MRGTLLLILTVAVLTLFLSMYLRLITFFYAEEKVKRVFPRAPFVLFHFHLFRAKVHPLVREKGCGKNRYEICCIINQTNTFESFVTKKVYKVNNSFNCDSEYLIYLFSCKICGIQYLGSTVDRSRLSWNNYKSCQRNTADRGTPNQNYFHQHFLSDGPNRLINDCETIFIDKAYSSDPSRREFFWMRVLKTIIPLGINIDKGYEY